MCDCVSKLFLFVLNFVIFALGVAVVALASVILSKGNEFQQLFTEGSASVPVVILIAGLCVLLIGFFGCCGALKESSCLLQTYAVIVIILLLMEIVGGILLLVNFDSVQQGIKSAMNKAVHDYEPTNHTDEAKALDQFQHDFHCCGVDGPADWQNNTHIDSGNVPDSCCKDQKEGCGKNPPKDTIFEKGCFEVFIQELDPVNKGLGIAAIILALVQIVCITCACSLAKKAKESQFV